MVSEFYKHHDRKSGQCNTCSHCAKEAMQKWTASKPKRPDGRKANARPKSWVIRACSDCGENFTARQMVRHKPRCPKNPSTRAVLSDADYKMVHPDLTLDVLALVATAEYDRKRKHKSDSLKDLYDMTIEELEQMLIAQKGLCAICHLPPEKTNRSNQTLHIDHDHVKAEYDKRGSVRALLCEHCNRGLGCFDDDPDLLRTAIAYLVRHNPALAAA
jgi:hypothetical protein